MMKSTEEIVSLDSSYALRKLECLGRDQMKLEDHLKKGGKNPFRSMHLEIARNFPANFMEVAETAFMIYDSLSADNPARQIVDIDLARKGYQMIKSGYAGLIPFGKEIEFETISEE